MIRTFIILAIKVGSSLSFALNTHPCTSSPYFSSVISARTGKTILHSTNDDHKRKSLDISDEDDPTHHSRRHMLRNAFNMAAVVTIVTTSGAQPSNAGLVQFPCDYDLMNTYHFMRAGESMLESEDLLSTNPLFMTNREDALSEQGTEQVLSACHEMIMKDINPSVVKYSIAAKSMDTADIIANEMQVGRNRLVPEYTFMDPRGAGLWNMQPLSIVEEAIWAMDESEGGKRGEGGRPPPTDDGTANEVISEQVIRLRQLMSILETQFSGDTILLVFGDGTSPALLMALMAGIPLNRVHEFNFEPGELRYDITRDSVLASLPDRKSEAYLEKISRGREKLKDLREELARPAVADAPTPIVESKKSVSEAKPRRKRAPVPKQSEIELESRRKSAALHVGGKSVSDTDLPRKSTPESGTSDSDPIFGGIMLGLFGMYASAQKRSDPSLDEFEISKNASLQNNKIPSGDGLDATNDIYNDDTIEVANDDNISLYPEIQKMETLLQTVPPFDIPEISQIKKDSEIQKMDPEIQKMDPEIQKMDPEIQKMDPEISKMDDLLQTVPPFEIPEFSQIEEDPLVEKMKIAEDAMEEYMNRDDGGAAWLEGLSSIIEEDDF